MKFIKYVTNLGLIANYSPMILDIRNVDQKKLYEHLTIHNVSVSSDILYGNPNYVVVENWHLYGAKEVTDLSQKFQNYFLVVLGKEDNQYCLWR